MDPLTHVFLPLTVAYAVRPDLFPDPRYLALGGFGLVPDLDKFVGMQGLFHALPALGVLSAVLVAGGRRRGSTAHAWLVVALLASHLVLDLLDGGPVPLLFPFVDSGAGLFFPATVTFGEGSLGVVVDGPLVALRSSVPRVGHGTFGLLTGYGFASVLAFLAVWYGRSRGGPGGVWEA